MGSLPALCDWPLSGVPSDSQNPSSKTVASGSSCELSELSELIKRRLESVASTGSSASSGFVEDKSYCDSEEEEEGNRLHFPGSVANTSHLSSPIPSLARTQGSLDCFPFGIPEKSSLPFVNITPAIGFTSRHFIGFSSSLCCAGRFPVSMHLPVCCLLFWAFDKLFTQMGEEMALESQRPPAKMPVLR